MMIMTNDSIIINNDKNNHKNNGDKNEASGNQKNIITNTIRNNELYVKRLLRSSFIIYLLALCSLHYYSLTLYSLVLCLLQTP